MTIINFDIQLIAYHPGNSRQEPRTKDWCRAMKEKRLAKPVFLEHPGPPAKGGHCPEWAKCSTILSQSRQRTRACLQARLVEAFSQLVFTFPKWLLLMLRWHKMWQYIHRIEVVPHSSGFLYVPLLHQSSFSPDCHILTLLSFSVVPRWAKQLEYRESLRDTKLRCFIVRYKVTLDILFIQDLRSARCYSRHVVPYYSVYPPVNLE